MKASRAEAREQAINTVGGVKRYITAYICTLPLASIYLRFRLQIVRNFNS